MRVHVLYTLCTILCEVKWMVRVKHMSVIRVVACSPPLPRGSKPHPMVMKLSTKVAYAQNLNAIQYAQFNILTDVAFRWHNFFIGEV